MAAPGYYRTLIRTGVVGVVAVATWQWHRERAAASTSHLRALLQRPQSLRPRGELASTSATASLANTASLIKSQISADSLPLLVVGPSNTGKTDAIYQATADRPVVVFSGREYVASLEGANFADYCNTKLLGSLDVCPVQSLAASLGYAHLIGGTPSKSLARTMELLKQELTNTANSRGAKPVIVIDDLQGLLASPKDRPYVEFILRSLVHLSKDRKLCDVVLASSDPFIGVSLEPVCQVGADLQVISVAGLANESGRTAVNKLAHTLSSASATEFVNQLGSSLTQVPFVQALIDLGTPSKLAIERQLQRPIREIRDALSNDPDGVLLWIVLQEMSQLATQRKRMTMRSKAKTSSAPATTQVLDDDRAEMFLDLHTLLLKDKLKGKEAAILQLLHKYSSILFYYREQAPFGVNQEEISATSSYIAPASGLHARAIARVVANDEVKRMIWDRERELAKRK